MADNAKWFVVHTYSGYENKVASNIKTVVENRGMQDEILDVLIPTETVREIKDGQEREVERKLFPGYVFVKVQSYKKKEKIGSRKASKSLSDSEDIEDFDGEYEEVVTMADEAWYVIRNTRGVTGFVGPESKPAPLRDDELIALGLADKIAKNDEAEESEDDFIDIFNVRIEVNYSVGDRVNVIGGQFDGMSGIVKSIDLEREVVTVNLPFMGRETPAELGLDEVELA